MTTRPYLISNLRTGLERDIEPWLLPEDAYPDLEDCYMFRGRIQRRRGFSPLGRLVSKVISENVGTANGASFSGNLAHIGISPGTVSFVVGAYTFSDTVGDGNILQQTGPGYVTAITGITQAAQAVVTVVAHNFVTGQTVYITNVGGMTQINNDYYIIQNTGANTITLNVDSTGFSAYTAGGTARRVAGTINYVTGAVTLLFTPALGVGTTVFATYEYYSLNPVMGLRTQELVAVNQEQLIAFDTVKSNLFVNADQRFEDITFYKITNVPFSWTGSNSDFFWSTNYLNAFFATNNIRGFFWSAVTIPNAANAVIPLAGHKFQVGDKVAFGPFTPTPAANFFVTVPASPLFTVTAITPNVDFTIDNPNAPGAVTASSVFVPTTNALGSGDGIRWFDGSGVPAGTTGWVNFSPQIDQTTFLMGGLIIVTYRQRMIILNSIEGTAIGNFTTYRQRARWSQNGTIYNASPIPSGYTGGVDANAWRSDIVGKGGFIDAPTQESIVSAEFYKDTLIVFFERSTWQLRYTGNETLPFIWERINVDFGGESTFSIIPFDAGIVAVGNYGIVSCDATGVQRIDQIIPDEVFDFHNENDGPKRVYGIRDYFQQVVYWTFPAAAPNKTFPDRVLVYNYKDGSYSFFTDSFTCFGYYQPSINTTWARLPVMWTSHPFPWNTAELQSDFSKIVAGNQQGFVFTNINAGSVINEANSLVVSGATQANPCIITSPNHNLQADQIIQISQVNGMVDLNGGIYRVSNPITANTFAIQDYRTVQNLGPRVAAVDTRTGVLVLPSSVSIVPGSVIISDTVTTFLDNGEGALIVSSGTGTSGTINYTTGAYSVSFTGAVPAGPPDVIVRYGQDVPTFPWYFVNSTAFAAYTSGGFILVRNGMSIRSKLFNPFLQEGSQVRASFIDLFVEGNTSSELTLNIFLNENADVPVEAPTFECNTTTGQSKVWKRVYTSSLGQFIQTEITFSDAQIVDPTKSDADFVLHAMMPWFSPSGRLTYGVTI